MGKIKPKKIKIGDTIGVITPSGNIYRDKKQIQDGIKILEKEGFKILFGSCFNGKYKKTSGVPLARAKEINSMFENKKVKAIFCSEGGDTANQVVDLINYDLIKKNPKILVGYSDICHILLSIYKKTGLVSYYGPNISTLSKISSKSKKHLFNMLKGDQIIFPKYSVIKEGKSEGLLIGGNLFVFNFMNKSKYNIDCRGKILFWEEIDDSVASVEYQLYQLQISGILEQLSGMIVGHISKPKRKLIYYKNILMNLTKSYDYPIIELNYFGHDINKLYTLPLGVNAKIDTKGNKFCLSESVVK
ncbi:MAG: LD-carboxypeptidase [Patescibacteria group bacterium]